MEDIHPHSIAPAEQIAKRFEDALASFIDKVKSDPNIIAVVLEGSLAYDKVWQKSDMDVTVIIREQKIETKSYCVDEDNLVINVYIMTRSDFKRMLGRDKAGSIDHSMFARAKVVYTTDDSLYTFLDDIRTMGTDDIEMSFFTYASWLIGTMEKVEKWLVVKHNPLYAQYYVLKCVDIIANMYLVREGIAPNRESVLRVMEMDPEFIEPLYRRPMMGEMTEAQVYQALEYMQKYLKDNLELLKQPVLRYMGDGEIKPVTAMTKHFEMDSHGIYHIFDFLTEMGVVEKVSQTIRITPKGKKAIEEVAFVYTQNLY